MCIYTYTLVNISTQTLFLCKCIGDNLKHNKYTTTINVFGLLLQPWFVSVATIPFKFTGALPTINSLRLIHKYLCWGATSLTQRVYECTRMYLTNSLLSIG